MNAYQRRRQRRAKPPEPEEELPNGLWRNGAGELTYSCRSCGESSEWYGTADEFDINNYANKCGRSPRCCP